MKRLLAGGLLTLVIAATLVFSPGTATDAQAATWHNVLNIKCHHDRLFTDVRLYPSRPTRLKYWTNPDWGETVYGFVTFRLKRSDTGAIVRKVGPIEQPTGQENWRTTSLITLPRGIRSYIFKVRCEDASFGFKLQQKY